MLVVLVCVALAILIVGFVISRVRDENLSVVVGILGTFFLIGSIIGGIKLAFVIGDSLPVVITENTYNIQELSSKPGCFVKEVEAFDHTLYIVQIDGTEVTYSSKKFDHAYQTCVGDQNFVKTVKVNTGRQAVWLYAFAVNTNDLTINTASCSGIWNVN